MNRIRRALAELHRLRREGPRGIAGRVVRRVYQRIDASSLEFPLLPGDVADSTRLSLPALERRPEVGSRLVIGWICTPPSAGSGGHTTMFRMIRALEGAGHSCVVYLYDRHHGDLEAHRRVIRAGWPEVRADIKDIASGLTGLHAAVATSWPTAHVLAARGGAPMERCYFIQDFEPFFFPRGSLYELAADTYRFGFHNIALGAMVRGMLEAEVGAPCRTVPFGVDTEIYGLRNQGGRSGVVLYAKPQVPRRGYLLAEMALAEFHRRHPEQEIHVYGDPVPTITVPVTRHERLRPPELDALYNRVVCGLAMSFTNISLVAEEMLASGAIPVVNDSPLSRADLSNDNVAWCVPTAGGIADELCRLVEDEDIAARAARAAGSVRPRGWEPAAQGVTSIIESAVYGGPQHERRGRSRPRAVVTQPL